MNLIGFDKNDEDCGANRFIEQTGYVPHGVCALLFHPDFVHHHKGMGEEYTLHPDCCSYQAVIKNAERTRQAWTNHNLKTLSKNLKKYGCDMYVGLMGCTNKSAYHREWIEDHPEIYTHYRGGIKANHCIFKRFSDGTYYEDFFIDKLCRVLSDYGFRGVHFSDCFSPMGGNISHGDFSTDLVEQFLDFSDVKLPHEIMSTLGDDSATVEDRRGEWIWENKREEWIEFNCARWEQFYKKLCDRVHAIGCEVMTLAMYCTDPFETKYCLGTDISKITKAGVDCITENILTAGLYLQSGADSGEKPYRFNRITSILPTMAAHIKDAKRLTMLGLYDATEEWDILHHAPCLHDRDLYGNMSYFLDTPNGCQRCADGYFLCLGDGIERGDWDKEHRKYEIAMSADVHHCISPMMLWSDHSYDNFLKEYIATRRPTPFNLFYEIANSGTMFGGCVRGEDIDSFSGTLFVADFDMLSKEEKEKVASYDRGLALVCFKKDADTSELNGKVTFEIEDRFSSHPLKACLLNFVVDTQMSEKIEEYLSRDDGTADVKDINSLKDSGNPLKETLPFTKVTKGFVDAMAYLLSLGERNVLSANVPHQTFRQKDGSLRLYLYNNKLSQYGFAYVRVKEKVSDTKIISDFPILPVRYKEEESGGIYHNYEAEIANRQSFEVKLSPGGTTIVDIIP